MFLDIENNFIHGGILTEDGDVICGCCGGTQEADDKGITWKILEVYDNRVNIDEAICGDDLFKCE